MEKYIQKVIHLELDGKHYYFGSLKALCDTFDREKIGFSYDTLRHKGITPETPYVSKRCIIREGKLITTPKENKKKKD